MELKQDQVQVGGEVANMLGACCNKALNSSIQTVPSERHQSILEAAVLELTPVLADGELRDPALHATVCRALPPSLPVMR